MCTSRFTFVSNVNKLVDRLTDRIPYLLLKTSKLLSLYTSKRKTSQGMVKKVCRYNGQLVQVQWTFGQNHEIILSTVLAFDCIIFLLGAILRVLRYFTPERDGHWSWSLSQRQRAKIFFALSGHCYYLESLESAYPVPMKIYFLISLNSPVSIE